MNVTGILGSLVYTYHAQEMWRDSPDRVPREPHSQPRRRAARPAPASSSDRAATMPRLIPSRLSGGGAEEGTGGVPALSCEDGSAACERCVGA